MAGWLTDWMSEYFDAWMAIDTALVSSGWEEESSHILTNGCW